MAFPQIGMEAVLIIKQFEANAKKYQSDLTSMEKKTADTASKIQDLTKKMGKLDPASDKFAQAQTELAKLNGELGTSQASLAQLQNSFKSVGIAVAAMSATFVVATKAIGELLQAGKEAAAIEDLRQSFINLTASSGISASKLLGDLQTVSRGTVDTVTLMRTANQALLAGGAQLANELPKLYEIAEASSRATGKSIDYVFTSLTKGIIKASPQVIDEADVYVKVGNAIGEYATKLGIAEEALTSQQRQLAVLNKVLAEGGAFVAQLGDQATRATDPFNQLDAQWKQFTSGLKAQFLPAAQDVANRLQGLLMGLKAITAFLAASNAVNEKYGANWLHIGESIKQFQIEFDKAYQTLDQGVAPIQDATTGMTGLADAEDEAAKATAELNKKIEELDKQKLEKLADIEKQLTRQLEDQAINRGRQLEDIEKNTTRQLVDIAIRRNRELADADLALSRKNEDMARESAYRRADLAKDYTKSISDLEIEATKKRNELQDEINKENERLEQQHQDRLYDIRQSAQDDISEAARKNDAVAVAARLRQQAIDIRDEQANYGREQRDLDDSIQEKRTKLEEDIKTQKENEAKRYREQLDALIESERRQQEELAISLARQDEDRRIAWARQEEDRLLALARQEEDMRLSWARQDEDFQRAKERRLSDLDDWYAKELEKLQTSITTQTDTAVNGIIDASQAISAATETGLALIADNAGKYLVKQVDPVSQRGNLLGGYDLPTKTSDEWATRHNYFAEGGAIVADKPTTITMGEAGKELGVFVPERKMNVMLGGRGTIGFDGIPQGLTAQQAQDLAYRAVANLVEGMLRAN